MAPITALAGIERAEGYTTEPGLEETLEWHRYGGITTAALAILLAFLAWRARRGAGSPGAARAFRWVLVLAALLVGITSHFGGELVHGAGYPFG
jgi:heme A synthase